MRLVVTHLLMALLIIPLATARAAATGSHFWNPPASGNKCESGTSVVPLVFEKSVYGWSPNNMGVSFAAAMSRNISRGVRSQNYNYRGFAQQLVSAAQARAFTQPKFYAPSRPSPIFLTSSILISLSYATDLLDARAAWRPGEREAVVKWGNILEKNQNKQKNPSRDSVAIIAAARMAWGAATNQNAIYKKGLSGFKKTGRLLNKNGFFEKNPRDNNEVVSTMVLAAAAADGVGQNAYGMQFKGVSLHDAVMAHAENTLRIGPIEITEGDTGYTGKYLKPNGYAAHLAWMPIYLSRYPNTQAAQSVRKLESLMKRVAGSGYYGTSVGGATACFWK